MNYSYKIIKRKEILPFSMLTFLAERKIEMVLVLSLRDIFTSKIYRKTCSCQMLLYTNLSS